MSTSTLSLFGEDSLTLVAAAFRDQRRAERVARALDRTPALHHRVALVAPDDPAAGRKFEPEQRGIWRTLVRSHVILGVAGLAAGLLAAAWLVQSWSAAAHSPWFTAMFAGTLGAFFGMLLAGLLTLRPDRSVVIRNMRDQMQKGKWAVVVHPQDVSAARRSFSMLQRAGGSPERSL